MAKTESMMCIAVGLGRGATEGLALHISVVPALLVGGVFGVAFAAFFKRRATSAAAGLIWGLALAFLVWVVFPAGFGPVINKGFREMAVLEGVRTQFPLLVAYLLCLGMPVGLALGAYNGVRASQSGTHFSWTRGVIAGGARGRVGRARLRPVDVGGRLFPSALRINHNTIA